MNINQLLKQAQNMQKKMKEMQEEIAKMANSRAKSVGFTEGMVKILADSRTDFAENS